MGPRILVLGGSGFLGAHVARAALEQGFEVVAASRDPKLPPQVGAARTRAFDALADGSLERLLEDERPHAVIVCTALPSIADCERYPVLARTLNADLPARVARWTAAKGARAVLVSTDLVFGATPPRAGRFLEDDPPAPVSEYGRTKAGGEARFLEADPRAVVARLPLLFGDSFGRGTGATDALLDAVRRGERPSLFTDEWRTPLDVAEAGRALVRLADAGVHGIVHLPGKERLSRHELGLRVLAAAGHAPEEALALVRATTRAEAGLGSRPADVCLGTLRAHELAEDRWNAAG